MNASSLSGECARRISVVFGEAAGVDMLGPSWLSRETITHPGPTVTTPRRRCRDYDALAVLLIAVKETRVCASSGDGSVWYSWIANSALSPDDAHTLVSFTAMSKTASAS